MNKLTNAELHQTIPTAWLGEEHQQMLQASLDYFKDIDLGMTHFQITHFVLNDKEFPTAASKYFQARKEMFSRYTNLVNQYHECRLLEAEAELLNVEMFELEETAAQKAPQGNRVARERATVHLLTVKREQKLMRIQFVKKEAMRQLREFQAFWQNHQHYGAMLKPGVTRELAEPEYWQTLASAPVTRWEKLKALVKGDVPRATILKEMLQGHKGLAPSRMHLSQEFLEPDRQKVLEGGSA